MTAVQPRHGWYRDPSGRHAMRYCDDGHWTAWAADDGGDPQFDETGAAIASEPSWLSTGPGRMVLVGFVAVAVAAVGSLLGGFMALAALFDTESSGAGKDVVLVVSALVFAVSTLLIPAAWLTAVAGVAWLGVRRAREDDPRRRARGVAMIVVAVCLVALSVVAVYALVAVLRPYG